MAAYNISYTDPLKPGFTIQPGGFDGPGGSQASTTLRLYGRGALEWGESVDEDLLRLAESFAGSTPPHNPVGGQLWHRTVYHFWDSTRVVGTLSGGSSYTNGTYTNTPLLGGSGVGAIATIVIAGNAVTTVTITSYGTGYRLGDILTATLPGGAGFSFVYGDHGWYVYNTVTKGWSLVAGTGFIHITATVPLTPIIGDYYIDPTTATLYRYDSAYAQEANTWLIRHYDTGPTNGIPTSVPSQELKIYDAYASQWTAPVVVDVQSPAVATPQKGGMWLDTSTGRVSMWSGTAWQNILGPSLNGTATVASANIDLGNTYKVVNVATPTNLGDAVNKSYADSSFLHINGGTLVGALQINAALNMNSNVINNVGAPSAGGDATNKTYVDTTEASMTAFNAATYVPLAGGTMTGTLTMNATVNMNSHQINNVAAPTAAGDATNKTYVDTNAPTLYASIAGSGKAGDIAVVAGVIYINSAPGVNWKQVFPAVYA